MIFDKSRLMSCRSAALSQGTGPVYKSWSALAGYFDGDGTVEFSIHAFTIKMRLAFDENWKPHLEGLKQFLELRGISAELLGEKTDITHGTSWCRTLKA